MPDKQRQIKIQPISEAPVKAGVELESCLLADGSAWTLGRWNGEGWFDLDGFPLMPLFFALLPPLEQLIGGGCGFLAFTVGVCLAGAAVCC